MSVILTPELEAEVTALYQEIRAAQAPATVALPAKPRAVIPPAASYRIGTILFAAFAIVLSVGFPAWILVKVVGLFWSR